MVKALDSNKQNLCYQVPMWCAGSNPVPDERNFFGHILHEIYTYFSYTYVSVMVVTIDTEIFKYIYIYIYLIMYIFP